MPRLNRKLTDTEIRKAKPKVSEYKLYDEGGLRLGCRSILSLLWDALDCMVPAGTWLHFHQLLADQQRKESRH